MKGLLSGSLIERYAIISVEKESHSVPMDEYITKRMKMASNLGIALVEIK